jgi:hypothetical protein
MFPAFLIQPPIRGPGSPIDMPAWYFDHFITAGSATATGPKFSSTADAAEWLTTLITSAIPKVADNADVKALSPQPTLGVLKTIMAGTNNDGVSRQLNGEAFVLSPGKEITFEAKVAVSAIAGTLMAIGLGVTTTTILAAGGQTLSASDFIGFTIRGTSGVIIPVVKGATVETLPTVATAVALVNNVFSVLKFQIRHDMNTSVYTIDFFVNGVKIAQHKSTAGAVPLDSTNGTPIGLTPSVAWKAQASTAFNAFEDYIFVAESSGG